MIRFCLRPASQILCICGENNHASCLSPAGNKHAAALLTSTAFLCAESQQFMQTRCREQIEQTCRERDQAVLDVQSLERAFSDLHRRFDKSKQIIANAEKVRVPYLYALVFSPNSYSQRATALDLNRTSLNCANSRLITWRRRRSSSQSTPH